MLFLYHCETPFKNIAETLEMEADTVTDYANLIREECSRDLLEHAELLGGPGIRVQVCAISNFRLTSHCLPGQS